MPGLNFWQNTVSVVKAVPVFEAGNPVESLGASPAVLLDSLRTIRYPTRGFAVNARKGPDVSFPLSTNQFVVGESFQVVIRGSWEGLVLPRLRHYPTGTYHMFGFLLQPCRSLRSRYHHALRSDYDRGRQV